MFFRYSLSRDGILTLKIVSDDFIKTKFKTSKELYRFISKNVDNKKLYGKQVRYVKVSDLDFADADSALQTVVKGNNAFAFDLYQKLKDEKGNIFFSPYSISTALAMIYAGSRGLTEEEMAKVLHLSLKDKHLLHSSFSKLQSELLAIQDKGRVRINMANSLWVQEGYHFQDTFIGLIGKYYGAGLNYVDFATKTETARKTINRWVAERTGWKIRELIKPGMIDSSTNSVLCNAIYFKGDWLRRFDKEETRDADFHISADRTVKVPMMNQKSGFKFKDFGDFSAIELPYEGDDLSMIIFLPEEINGLAGLERNLTADNVKNWIDELYSSYESEVLLSLPRFKTTYEFKLSDLLAQMGMPHAFKDSDFSGITVRKDFFINQIVHSAFIDINEEGTEAAAAMAISTLRGGGISMPKTFRADHPFVFLIRENQTGSILFIGRIINPAK
ncbi:MAG: serpin family protein [Nitrospirae bacterium]|nr:serpin family protein [Nitrospirota bacterium]